MRLHIIAVAAALAIGMAGAQAQTLPERYKTAGKIVIGTTPNYPPVTFKDPQTNQLAGYDIEIGNAIGEKLGVRIEWQDTSFEQMISAVATDRIDLILGGMNDIPARRETLDFVDYMKSGVQFFVQHKRAGEFKAATDLCGKTVGASRRTNFPKEIEAWSAEQCVKAGKPPIRIMGTEGSADARAQLRQGRIDAGAQGNESLPYLMKLDPDTYNLVGEPFALVYQGIGVSRKKADLRDAVAAALKAVIADGTYKKIVDKYGVQPNAVVAVAINSEPVK
ncbi:ABC transporter substrate-binding protein [Limobrevibacterium gyesilva]|uniref:ABC transporter substrate-binding protein n=1 Tax=Limobrevibacterium gyesilva TaxID=2991712 RepID=A0AA42CJ42_9PROT|nr:ABC transporter substrate-binding protein [Limobrevibacterium gyesilva]MCW3476525.1 ABC transporter substrate-binding protein [Limobrevibacterium gyesilva]